MGKRVLKVNLNPDLAIEMCKAREGLWRTSVVDNLLPEDAHLVRVMSGTGMLLLESEAWPDIKPYERVILPTISYERITEEGIEPTPPEDGEGGQDAEI